MSVSDGFQRSLTDLNTYELEQALPAARAAPRRRQRVACLGEKVEQAPDSEGMMARELHHLRAINHLK